ncbi:hypothetical protein GX48_08360 [Paracoccidioides brasiliensis]|nr:hypothetical protein GX48_08360 [Paracoccidioides brasiliensis]
MHLSQVNFLFATPSLTNACESSHLGEPRRNREGWRCWMNSKMYDNERLSIRGIPESDKTRIYRLDPGIGEQHSGCYGGTYKNINDSSGPKLQAISSLLGIFTVRLNGDALAKFQPWIDTCIEEQRTPENVFHQLDVLFLDPTHQAKALDWLNRNRQKNTALANYLPEFDRNLLEAGGQNWDIIQINMLSRNLNFELLNQSVGRQKLTTYSEYCANLRQLDNDLAQFCTVQGCCNRTVPFSPPPTTTAPDPMDWAPHVSAGRPRISNISRKDVTDRIT